MGGLHLGVMGGVKAQANTGGFSGPGNSSASGAAFGPMYDSKDPGTGVMSAIKPDDAFGVSFTLAVVAIVALAFVRHSLPR